MSNLRSVFKTRISLVVVTLSGLLVACGGPTELLPHPVYYSSGTGEDTQVWRLETDGSTKVQLTHEGAGVSHFAVSPTDGSLAFVSDNSLYLVDGRGLNRILVADGSQVDKEAEDYVFRGFVESPFFSPNGQTIAYAFDGLHLYDIDTGEDQHVLRNLGSLLGEPFVLAQENYYPGAWSPDGDKLLIIMSYFEGSTLAVMEPGEAEPFRRLWSDGPVCCTYHWTPDGRSVLVANPTYGVHWPGLWRYDAETGEGSELVTTLAGSPQFVGWPVQLPSGELIYFHGERFVPEEGIPMVMVRSGPDGTDRTQVRPEEFHISDALWAEDGSLVLVLQVSDTGAMRVAMARPDGSPLQVLIEGEGIRHLAWGP